MRDHPIDTPFAQLAQQARFRLLFLFAAMLKAAVSTNRSMSPPRAASSVREPNRLTRA